MNVKEEAKKILATLTLERKCKLLSGRDFWHLEEIPEYHIPSYRMSDGPYGLRVEEENAQEGMMKKSKPAICYPTGSAMACSFDRDLFYRMGAMLAKECRMQGVSILLGPAINHKRSPLCGRNFEYLSEDPFVSGELGSMMVKGLQKEGIGACVKHYACNNQEKGRMISNSVVDDKALNEIYLRPFEYVIKKASPWALMTSYNMVNGTYSSENTWLMKEMGRKSFGFDGAYITDWGALSSLKNSFASGCNLQMPGGIKGTTERIMDLVQKKELTEAEINEAVLPTIELILKCHESALNKDTYSPFLQKEAENLALESAKKSIVLLKNNEDILPLKTKGSGSDKTKLLIVGQFAKIPRMEGSGSSKVNSLFIDNPFDFFKYDENFEVSYADGYELDSLKQDIILIDKAKTLAKHADIVLIFAGLPNESEFEGYDRDNLLLPESHNELIKEIAQVNSHTVVVLESGSPVSMPWIDQVPGVVFSYLSGMCGGQAIYEILTGKLSPSGHLAETFPNRILDTPTYPNYGMEKEVVLYKESIYTGYRYYQSFHKNVLFPFGYGLTYTKFSYDHIILTKEQDKFYLSLDIQNIGNYDASQVIQLYLHQDKKSLFRPNLELIQFQRFFLKRNESQKITVSFTEQDLASYDLDSANWSVENSKYTLCVGTSVENIIKEIPFSIKNSLSGTKNKVKIYNGYLQNSDNLQLTDENFGVLLGGNVPKKLRRTIYQYNTPISQLDETLVGKMILKMMISESKKRFADSSDVTKMIDAMLLDLPLRSLTMGGEAFGYDFVDGIIKVLNGKYISGAKTLTQKEKPSENKKKK